MKQSFITSYLTFYMKASVSLEGNFVKTSNPNSILKIVPLGSTNKTIPVDQISSIEDSFKLDFKSFLWGLFILAIGYSDLKKHSFVSLLLMAYSILTILSSFQTRLNINLTSGHSHYISVIIFEKSNLINCKKIMESLIQNRYNDTNVTSNTDRLIEHFNK